MLGLLSASTARRDKLECNAAYRRKLLTEAGFDIKEGESPIVPVMLYDAKTRSSGSTASEGGKMSGVRRPAPSALS